MPKQKKPEVGDVFFLRFKEYYLFGKVLFSIDHQYDKIEKSPKQSPLNYLDKAPRNTYLIEMYAALLTSPLLPADKQTLIPRMWVTFDGLKNVEWGIVTKEKVDYKSVEFPEVMTIWSEGSSSYAVLQRGEFRYPTSITKDQYENYHFRDSITDISVVPYLCLNMMGKQMLIDEDENYLRKETLKNVDLFFNPSLRETVYTLINTDPHKSYYELSKENGKDLARFYV
jgi:hypothetical protein